MKMSPGLVRYAVSTPLLVLVLSLSSCATSTYKDGLRYLNQNNYAQATKLLEQAEVENPTDARVKRDLGVAYFKTKRLDEAIEKLSQAQQLESHDGKTVFYLGLAYEKKDRLDDAIDEYKQYLHLCKSKHFKRNISIRIKQLGRDKINNAVAQAIAKEKEIDASTFPENSVAVLYFHNLSSAENLTPLQKGLTQMLITDLSKAKKLSVVERTHLQQLVEELELGTTGMVYEETAPRVGKLIGARNLVQGAFTDLADEQLRIDASLAATTSAERSEIEEVTGKLSAIFRLEKDLVFKVIDELGVELTREEREAIQKVDTESLLAFMAYSRGLDFEDRRMFPEARAEYQKASDLDPNFGMARQSLEGVDFAQAASETPAADAQQVESEFEAQADETASSLKASRLVSSSFAAQTGQAAAGDNDTRETAQDAFGTDKPTLNNAVIPVVIPLPPN